MAKRDRGVSAAELAREGATELAPQPDEAPVDSAAPVTSSRRREAAPRPQRAAAEPRNTRRRTEISPLPERAPLPVRQEIVEYLPDRKRHMSEMGLVATGGFICRVGGVRHSVRMGAPKSTIPKEIQALMAASGVGFGHAMAPVKPGSLDVTVIDDEEDDGVPRARRTHRPEKNAPTRQFRKPRALPQE